MSFLNQNSPSSQHKTTLGSTLTKQLSKNTGWINLKKRLLRNIKVKSTQIMKWKSRLKFKKTINMQKFIKKKKNHPKKLKLFKTAKYNKNNNQILFMKISQLYKVTCNHTHQSFSKSKVDFSLTFKAGNRKLTYGSDVYL